jgi:7,8-dihydropterin-6-yl-methyl-4-(beta-D-ribofuranosyl)aminobenzene 5'-phosphate synthase
MSVDLREVDRIEVLTIMDNYVDLLLESTTVVTRPPKAKGGMISRDTLVGEHGLSLLVTVSEGSRKHTVLLDTGYSALGVPHNIEHLGLDLKEVEAIVLSHGHMDHLGSLNVLLEKMPKPMPVLVHPYAFTSPRYVTRRTVEKTVSPSCWIEGELRNVEVKS